MTLATKNNAIILKDGKLAENCACCGGGWYCYGSCCPCLVVAFETSGDIGQGSNCFDLGPYLQVGLQYAGRPFRLVEVGSNCDGIDPGDEYAEYTWHGWGFVDPDGKLNFNMNAGGPFPAGSTTFCSKYPYRGYLRLQIGCENPDIPNNVSNAFFSEDCTDGAC